MKPTPASSAIAKLTRAADDLPPISVHGLAIHEDMPAKVLMGAAKTAFANWNAEHARLLEMAALMEKLMKDVEKHKRRIIVPEGA